MQGGEYTLEQILLHSCCAPCSVHCVDALRAEGIEPTSLWFNPNIHPYQEYKARRDTLIGYGETAGFEVRVLDDYGLRDFVRAVASDIEGRCAHCYSIRLGTAAKYAAENGFKAFTSSLLISPYQNHALLKEVAERAADTWHVRFQYQDFRPLFRQGQECARELGFYIQKYCGCVFSEQERYLKPSKIIR